MQGEGGFLDMRLLVSLALGCFLVAGGVLASPPVRNWPEPVEVRLEMISWTSRDASFEVEVSVEPRVIIPETEVVVAVSQGVELETTLPGFQGTLDPKKPLHWRLRGVALAPRGEPPHSLSLGVRYRFPVKAMRKAFAKRDKLKQREFGALYGEERRLVRVLPLARPPRKPLGSKSLLRRRKP
jgi:hypothetical protein